jgi:N-acetylglutamate synthase-like GNAT family acetyltransferase
VNEIVETSSSGAPAPLPEPRVPISTRPATTQDMPFIDSLQKAHRKQVGFMPAGQLAGKIKAGDVIIAEDDAGQPVGYCIGTDRYFKHDDVGIIYHLNVAPGSQRGFVGATLLKAMFDRAAYGCKLFCCWCAQDIEANRFWEGMGFVPLAFRAGSEKKSRVHIFWQKRIRSGDEETPWWFPSQTTGGSIREDRLVLPIPPGTHWSDAKPMILPGVPREASQKTLPAPRQPRLKSSPAPKRRAISRSRALFFTPPAPPAPPAPAAAEKPKREKKPKRKNDPKLVAAARELRDRYLEHVNTGGMLLEGAGKYDVTRALPDSSSPLLVKSPAALLPAA